MQKINQKNTWDLGLIDHLCDIIKVEEEDDVETNFQKVLHLVVSYGYWAKYRETLLGINNLILHSKNWVIMLNFRSTTNLPTQIPINGDWGPNLALFFWLEKGESNF